MPIYPKIEPSIKNLGGSVFSSLSSKILKLKGEIYPLHIGDTWMEPGKGCKWSDLGDEKNPKPNTYANPHGLKFFIDKLVEKIQIQNKIDIKGPNNVLVTHGATGGLAAIARATISKGDNVLILAPYWPLIKGIVINAHGIPVDVPVLHKSFTADSLFDSVSKKINSKTSAIYINTPCNPNGKVLHEKDLSVIIEIARKHNLWIWSDEVYEDYIYEGKHISIGKLAPERTITVFSFSKAYGLAGYRCAYITGPKRAILAARKVTTFTDYSVATPSQYLAYNALTQGNEWKQKAYKSYKETGYKTADILGLERPQSGTFLFFNVEHVLQKDGLLGFLMQCLDYNLILAPGESFGEHYKTWVRICFTCSPPDIVIRGAEKLATLL